MKDKQWYVDHHRKMWNWIADVIIASGSTVDIFELKGRYCNAKGQYYIKFNCFACEYTLGKRGGLNCSSCLFYWSELKKQYGCEAKDSLYHKCLNASSWKEQAELARKIANLPVREEV